MEVPSECHFVLRGLSGKLFAFSCAPTLDSLRALVFAREGVPPSLQLLSSHGKNITSSTILHELAATRSELSADTSIPLSLALSLAGGKGGFGSLLRSSRSKKKTTNFGSSRTLDGRRVRDIENEQRRGEAARLRALAEEEERKKREAAREARELEKQKLEQELALKRKEIVENVAASVEVGILAAKAKKEREEEEERKRQREREKKAEAKMKSLPGMEDLSFSSSEENDEEKDEKSVDEAHEEVKETPGEDDKEGESNKDDVENGERRGMKRPLELPTADDQKPKAEVDLTTFQTVEELEGLGLETLKNELSARDLKSGGSLKERAQRLWSVRGLTPEQYNPALLAIAKNKRRRKE